MFEVTSKSTVVTLEDEKIFEEHGFGEQIFREEVVRVLLQDGRLRERNQFRSFEFRGRLRVRESASVAIVGDGAERRDCARAESEKRRTGRRTETVATTRATRKSTRTEGKGKVVERRRIR